MVNGLKNLMAIAAETEITFAAAEKLKATWQTPLLSPPLHRLLLQLPPQLPPPRSRSPKRSLTTTWVLTSSVKLLEHLSICSMNFVSISSEHQLFNEGKIQTCS